MKLNRSYSIYIFVIAILISIGLIIESKKIPFMADDQIHFIDANYLNELPNDIESLLSSKTWSEIGPTWAYRPVLGFIYYLEKKIYNFDKLKMRILNLFFHLLTVLVFLSLLKKISKDRTFENLKYFLGGTLLLHTILWHNIIYISARSTIVVALLILLSIRIFLIDSRWKWSYLLAACIAWKVKETGILAFVFPLLVSFGINLKGEVSKLKSYINLKSVSFGIFLLIAATFLLRHLIFGLFDFYAYPMKAAHNSFMYLFTQLSVLGLYIKNFLFPSNWAFYHGIPLLNLSDILEWFKHFVFVILLLVFHFLPFKPRKGGWALLLAFLSVFPTLVFPRELIATDQRPYLAYIFLSIYVFEQRDLILRLTKIMYGLHLLRVTGILIIIGVSIESYSRIKIYSNPMEMLYRDISRYKVNLPAQSLYAQKHMDSKNHKIALQEFLKAESNFRQYKTNSTWFKTEHEKVFHQIVTLKIGFGDLNEAVNWISKCEELDISNGRCFLLSAKVDRAQKKYEDALFKLDQIRPVIPLIQLEKALIYYEINNPQKVIEIVEPIIKSSPFDLTSIQLAIWSLSSIGESKKANEIYKQKMKFFEQGNHREIADALNKFYVRLRSGK